MVLAPTGYATVSPENVHLLLQPVKEKSMPLLLPRGEKKNVAMLVTALGVIITVLVVFWVITLAAR